MNFIADDAVIAMQEREGLKWRLVNTLMRTEAFRDTPDNAVVLAPSLWEGLDPHFGYYKQYWSEYVRGHSGRPIRFVKEADVDELGDIPLFYFEVQPLTGARAGVGLFALVKKSTNSSALFVTDSITVIGDEPYPDAGLSVLTVPSRSFVNEVASGTLNGDWEQPGAGDFECANRSCVATVYQPRMILGTARLVHDSGTGHNVNSAVALDFSSGFSVLEHGPEKYWRWSDGTDGTGILSVRNGLSSPVTARLQAKIDTGSMSKTRLDVTIGGDKTITSYVASGDVLDERFVAKPGSTPIKIHSYGPRIGSGADSRYIVFGLENWSLSVLPKVEIAGGALQEAEDPVGLTFDRGFFQTERQNGNYWRWSTESSGVMSLWNRTPKAMEVMFSSELFTTYGQKYPVEVVFPGGRVTLQVNGDRVSLTRLIQLPPGRSEITVKSSAPPLPRKGNDPRTFAFGIGRWKLYIPFVEVPQ